MGVSISRGIGYSISIIMIIVGFLFFPLGLIISVMGFIFIWMLNRSASQERIEKQLKGIGERDRERSLREMAEREGKEDLDYYIKAEKRNKKIKKYLIPPIVIVILLVILSIAKNY